MSILLFSGRTWQMRLPGLGLLLLWQHLGSYDIDGEVISRLAVTASARLRSVMV